MIHSIIQNVNRIPKIDLKLLFKKPYMICGFFCFDRLSLITIMKMSKIDFNNTLHNHPEQLENNVDLTDDQLALLFLHTPQYAFKNPLWPLLQFSGNLTAVLNNIFERGQSLAVCEKQFFTTTDKAIILKFIRDFEEYLSQSSENAGIAAGVYLANKYEETWLANHPIAEYMRSIVTQDDFPNVYYVMASEEVF